MKKLLLGMLAIVAMIATSCQQEVDLGVNAGETATVSFNVGTPTRAYSDGATATVLQYAVYNADGEELTDLTKSLANDNAETINMSTTVNLQLVTGNTYAVIFWAAAPNAPYSVDFDSQTMTVDYTTAVSNDENRDAFYKYHTFTVTGAQTETIELKRPFAQLNIGTNDYAAATSAGYTPETSWVTVKNIYTTLNLNSGAVADRVEVTFAESAIPTTETFPVTGYEYLAMNYLLVNERENIEVEFSYKDAEAVQGEETKTRTVGSVPVQRNHRTNLYGSILTSDVAINVIIKPEYEEPAHEADALYLAAAVGGEVTLTEDVVLTSPLIIQANMTLNLNGKTISASNHKSVGPVIKNKANFTLIGGTVSSLANNGGSAIQNEGTMVVEGTTLNGAPNADGSWPAYAVNNTGVLTLNNVKITSYHGGVASYGNDAVVTLNDCELDMRGIAGFTSHGMYTYNAGIIVVNGGNYANKAADQVSTGGSVINGAVTVNAGTFSGRIENYYGTPVLNGGVYSVKPNAAWIAAGKKVINAEGVYVVVDADVNGYLASEVTNKDGVDYVGDAFADGHKENTLWYNKWIFDGEAAIKVVDKTYKAIIVENCVGNFKNDVITIDNDNNSVMILQNLDFTIAEGKKLIKSTKPIYQVFMANITINGEKMTDATIAQYLENVAWYQVVEEI